MFLKYFLPIAITLIVLVGCKASKEVIREKDDSLNVRAEIPDAAEIQKRLLGTWEWHKTLCCFRLPNTIQDTSALIQTIRFTKQGLFERYLGDEITGQEEYLIKIGLMNDNRPTIRIAEGPPAIVHFKQDTLILDYGYMDLQTEYYVKMKR